MASGKTACGGGLEAGRIADPTRGTLATQSGNRNCVDGQQCNRHDIAFAVLCLTVIRRATA